MHSLCGEQVSRVGIGNGQGIAVWSVPHAEEDFEVGTPDLVGRVQIEDRINRLDAPDTAFGLRLCVSFEDEVAGGDRRQVLRGQLLRKDDEQLLRTRSRVLLAQ